MIKIAEKQYCPACGKVEIGRDKYPVQPTCGFHYWQQSYGQTFVFFPKSGNWILIDRLKAEVAPTASEYAWW